jgi:Mn-dependent DtxR family transcriptional regulator
MEHSDRLASLLIALLDLAENDIPASAGALATRVGDLRPTEVAEALLVLERRGLVDAGRARLTFAGLAVAASLRASHAADHRGVAA